MIKHILILATVLALLSPLTATSWKTYTNTTNVNDFVEANNKLYVATWGGLAEFDHNPQLTGSDAYVLKHTYTNIDGLTNNDIRVLDYISATKSLWMGLYAGGVNILTSNGIKVVNENSGLPSDKITGIVHSDSLFFVATDKGLAVFYQLANVSFPLLRQVYTNENTQGGLVDDSLKCMKLSASNYLYIGTPHGLNYVHIDSLNYYSSWHVWDQINPNTAQDRVNQIAIVGNHLAAATNNGLGIIDLDVLPYQWTIYTTANGLLSNSIYAVDYSDEGDLYFSYGNWDEDIMTLNNPTDISLSKFSDNVFFTYPEDASTLYNKAITRITFLNGLLSVSSWGDGLFIQDGTQWFNVKTNCIGFNTISCITRSKDKMWFGSGILDAVKTRKGTRGVSSFDGTTWQTLTVANSPMISDNVLSVGVDNDDRVWMASYYIPVPNAYGWERGVNIFDPVNDTWKWIAGGGFAVYNQGTDAYDFIATTPSLLSSAASYVFHDSQNRMFLCCYNGGVIVVDSLLNQTNSFQIYNSAAQRVILVAESDSSYFFGSANDHGITYWDDKSHLPGTGGFSWHNPPAPELNNCWVYGVVSFTNDFGENEVWVAASNGLYSFDGTHWYKYDVDVKRRIFQNGSWGTDPNNGLYYVDEERLFGSVHTTPTSIFLDPFKRIWIGSRDNGFSMWDTSIERFTNYNTENSPLISNYVVSLGYEPVSGDLYIGTPDGLNTFKIGIEQPPASKLRKVVAFPNPFKPDQDTKITLQNTSATGTFPPGNNTCRIYSLSGELVVELKQTILYNFTWNGRNGNGKKCSTGIYYYVITTADGDVSRGKIALIR